MNMFSRTPGSVTKINISVADCTVSHTYVTAVDLSVLATYQDSV